MILCTMVCFFTDLIHTYSVAVVSHPRAYVYVCLSVWWQRVRTQNTRGRNVKQRKAIIHTQILACTDSAIHVIVHTHTHIYICVAVRTCYVRQSHKCEEPLVQPVHYVMQYDICQVDNDTLMQSIRMHWFTNARENCAKIIKLPFVLIAPDRQPPGNIFVLKILFSYVSDLLYSFSQHTHARIHAWVCVFLPSLRVWVSVFDHIQAYHARSAHIDTIHQYAECP